MIDTSTNFDNLGRYILADYDHQRPFSSFLPGIAGLEGIPMWLFYVNRGQAVCSFGVEDKDHPILEFHAANRAYQTTALMGFRTFLNGQRGDERWQREAFAPWHAPDVQRRMMIGMNDVEIEEINPHLGYQINVLYFLLPGAPFSGLFRQVRFKNLQDTPLSLEVLDGLPGIVPYGVDNGALKHITRTIEAWMQVDNLDDRLPFYRLKATPGDTAEVHRIQAGNYAFAFYQDELLPAVADPTVVFGLDTSHTQAHRFHEQGLHSLLSATQILEGRSLCAFFGAGIPIAPGEVQTLTSLYGYTPTLATIQAWVDTLRSADFVDQKLQQARTLTDDLTEVMHTESAFPSFDGYCRLTFLDNLLRGGWPLILGEKHITHVYARKHGDIERDYNYFVIPPEFYSQGNGNYRDVNQNRRNDVYFAPEAGEFNIRMFMSLIQADGYNPLVINGLNFSVPGEKQAELLAYAEAVEELSMLLQRRFTPGELLDVANAARLSIPVNDFLALVFAQAEAHIRAEHGEGYWVDHWLYNLDLIDAYLSIFPENKVDLLFKSEPLPFFDDAHHVQPRSARYVLSHGRPLQLNAVAVDPEKAALIQAREKDPHWARADHGQGEIFRLPLISKLVLLALIKFATRDPEGMGVQMEAGRPGWYDALNGLPGLFGSSMPETYALLRLVNLLLEALAETPQAVILPIEAQILIDAIGREPGDDLDAFARWDQLSSALEAFRESTRLGFDGGTLALTVPPLLKQMRVSLERGIAKAHTFIKDIPPTYFTFQVSDYNLIETPVDDRLPQIKVTGFEPRALPPFLEGPVHYLKLADQAGARALAQAVIESDLYDRQLGMYKVNASLAQEPFEIGRARAFTPGWLENESIWLHMSFKYLLALLQAGVYDFYFDALQTHLPAFMDPAVYGRSPLENSSFIVSSAHPDAQLHGNGFVARLSGSTAEFLSMWTLMTAGKQPFRLVDDELVLAFNPILPGWLFNNEGVFAFRFLGMCTVRLHNPARVDTTDSALKIKAIDLHAEAESIHIEGEIIPSPYAERVRQGYYPSIDIHFA